VPQFSTPWLSAEQIHKGNELTWSALLVQHGSGDVRKAPGRYSTDNTVPKFIERYFSKKIHPTERKSRPTKKCVTRTKRGRRQCFGVLIVRLVCMSMAASRPTI
jgi:hypothetical protein